MTANSCHANPPDWGLNENFGCKFLQNADNGRYARLREWVKGHLHVLWTKLVPIVPIVGSAGELFLRLREMLNKRQHADTTITRHHIL